MREDGILIVEDISAAGVELEAAVEYGSKRITNRWDVSNGVGTGDKRR